MGSGIDDPSRKGSVWRNFNGNRNVPYLWNDADKRNLNLNWYDNDWNDNYRFLASRQSLTTSTVVSSPR